eukprot:4479738-Alexandrium_andersonii.AAC.1
MRSLPSSTARRAPCQRMRAPASWLRARGASGAAAAAAASPSWRPRPSRASWPTSCSGPAILRLPTASSATAWPCRSFRLG